MRYSFDDCVLDIDAMRLTVGGEPVDVQPQVLDVLQVLVDERDRVVPKSELLDRVWGHTFVTESALTSRIKSARRAIGDNGRDQRSIRTVHGRGYQFVAAVQVAGDPGEDGPGGSGAEAERRVLPSYLSELIGREGDVAAVAAMLEAARLVTIVGPGGVGKTRLAVAVARQHPSRHVQFVDLTLVGEPAQVLPHLATQLGLSGEGVDAVAAVAELLQGRSALLVLDNVEHVIDAAGAVGDLLRAVDDLSVVATSREHLRLDGEQVYELEPLALRTQGDRSTSSAVALFERVARAADAGFDLAPHRLDVERICRAVDGLPLAIELAAGHVRTLPPGMLAARLSDRLRSASSSRRDGPARQQTMTDTIDWSLNLLRPVERTLFARIGVFVGDVPIETIEAVCGADLGADTVDTLGRLVDQSMVRRRRGRDGAATFGMLVLLRERARTLLAELDPEGTIPLRHCERIADLVADAESARWDGVGGWIDSLADLQPETRAAFGWAATNGHWELAGRIVGALGAFWHREGGQSDAMAWAVEVQSHLEEMSVPTRGRVLTAHGLLSWHRDDQASARRSWVESLHIHDDAGDAPRTAEALALLAVAELGAPGRHGQARTSLDRAVELAREVGAPGLLWEVLNVRGEFLRATGDDAEARRSYEEAASIAERVGDDASLSISLANLSYLACHDGRFDEGRDIARRALVLCWALGRRLLSAWSVSELAGPACGLGEHELAARLIGASERAMEALGGHRYPADVAEHERVVGDVLAALGRDRFERLRAEGACLTLDEAVALALGE